MSPSGSPSNGRSYAAQADAVFADVQAFLVRTRELVALRTARVEIKGGQLLSDDNRDRLDSISGSLGEIRELLNRTEAAKRAESLPAAIAAARDTLARLT